MYRKKEKARVRVIEQVYKVYCSGCGWVGKRTRLTLLKHCPKCERMYTVKYLRDEKGNIIPVIT